MNANVPERVYPWCFANRRRPYVFAPLLKWPAIQMGRIAGRPGLIFNTLPKSASVFIWDALAKGLGLVQCRIQLSDFPETLLMPHHVARLAKGGVIAQSHFGPSRHNLLTMLFYGVDRLVVHVRDPRQALLSWVHHVRKKNTVFHPDLVSLHHRPPQQMLQGNLEELVTWHIKHYLPLEIDWIQGWLDVCEDPEWHDLKVLLLSFEDFKRDNDAYFRKIFDLYGLNPSSFQAPAQTAGKLHFRKGLVSEWKEVFTAEQIEMTKSIVPSELVERFGWEQA